LTIVSAVRRAVPAHLPVSAKMRLGFNDDSRAVECALAIEGGGATELVVHARTKADAYRPPAYWDRIADIRAAVRIPVVANGEIWTVQDALRCREVSGSDMLMLGRGMVTDPGLALAIKAAVAHPERQAWGTSLLDSPSSASAPMHPAVSWQTLLPLIADFWQLVCARLERRQQAGRLKQWLNFLRHRYPEAELAYMALRALNEPAAIDQWLADAHLRTDCAD
jgi:tRNA-dihydrouridine synthase C